MTQGHNPYEAPTPATSFVVAEVAHSQGVWRDGPLLVMEKTANLPDICVKTNTPTKNKLKRKMYWHHPAVYLAVLFNLIIYAILAMVLRKQAVIYIGLSDARMLRRKRAIWVAWITGLLGVASFFGGVVAISGPGGNGSPLIVLVLLGLVMILASLIAGMLMSRIVRPQKIDDHYVWLRGVHPEYLARFPELASMK